MPITPTTFDRRAGSRRYHLRDAVQDVVVTEVRLGAAHWCTHIVHLRRDAGLGGTRADQGLERGYEREEDACASVEALSVSLPRAS